MKVIIWSDFVCPFCYIGIKNLEEALENKGYDLENVEIEYKSFQLEPDAKYVPGRTYKEAMVERKAASEEDIEKMLEQINVMAKRAGLQYNFDEMKLTDTFPAHRLFQYAKEEGKGYEYYNHLYESFFTEGELISDSSFLKETAQKLGLDGERAAEIINSEEEYAEEVVREIQEASRVGAKGVPFFVFEEKYGLSGAQPAEVFEQVLTQIEEGFEEEE
ncbi:MAG: DsbA family oxidoreductase [Atopostipes suicloacalis]|nr:DsbA family oxidoreductase [Atopostipes suicloacalis]